MDINLKQDEIASAVRDYVANSIGINLTGKHLGINFSMGRGANALVANLSITDKAALEVPGFTDRDALEDKESAPKAELHVIKGDPLAEKSVPADEFVAAKDSENDVKADTKTPETKAEDTAVTATASKAPETSAPAGSIFGTD